MSPCRLAVLFCLCGFTLWQGCSSTMSSAEEAQDLGLLKTFIEELVPITPGKPGFPPAFEMGTVAGPAETQPQHLVEMQGPFSMAKYEVPQNLYRVIMGNNPSRWQGDRNSAESMSWTDAQLFCTRITAQLQSAKLMGDDEVIRLPTEAEWEYCCRAGTTTAYSFGEQAQSEQNFAPRARILDEYGWHTGNAAGNDPAVGVLKPNPWGLYDMHGYLWEYCEDGWHDYFTAAPEVSSPAWTSQTKLCVLRGGSWKDSFEHLQCTSRRSSPKTIRDDSIGFRCVRAKRVAPKDE